MLNLVRSMADQAPAYHRRRMAFPIAPPVEPMLAKPTPELPVGEGWRYEPKWDGFRALVFRDGPELYLQSPRPEATGPILPGAARARSGRWAGRRRASCSTARS